MLRKRIWKIQTFIGFVVFTLLSSAVALCMPVSASSTVLSAPIIEDGTLTPDSTFYINITIADVADLWGFQFVLCYDTSVLTATSHSAYDPFVNLVYSEINDKAGYAEFAYCMPFGTNVGFTGSASLVRIDFTVDALGTSILHLNNTKLSDPVGNIINHETADGFFTNLVLPPRELVVKLTGEHDYTKLENVRIRFAALVRDAETMEPMSNADVTIEIYDPDGNLWVSDAMVEKLVETGIYEWETDQTIRELKLEKGIYLVYAEASFQGGPTASDILQFHIDPPAEESPSYPLYYYVIVVSTIIAGGVGLIVLRKTYLKSTSTRTSAVRHL